MGSWRGHDKSGRASQRWQPWDWSFEGMQAFSWGGWGTVVRRCGKGRYLRLTAGRSSRKAERREVGDKISLVRASLVKLQLLPTRSSLPPLYPFNICGPPTLCPSPGLGTERAGIQIYCLSSKCPWWLPK